jgi:two-component system, OmpR family, phosphate regulon sensor histidine kinase PhoR
MNTGDVLALILVLVVMVLSIRWAALRRRLRDQSFEHGALRRDLARASDQLRAAQQQTATLADAAFDALLVLDAERRIVTINQTGRELFSATPQVVGQTLMALIRHHELDVLVGKALQGEPVLESQMEIRERSFRVRIIAGESRTVILALQDVTELLRLARARRDMVANFSHDLRTPISSIRLLVDTLTQNFGRHPERDKRTVGKIAGEMDSLEHMTQELIDLSMIESGKAIIRMVPVSFAAIVKEALDVMATQIEQKKLEVDNQIPGDLRVLADPDQTRRVITNVIHNAVKFTPSRGQIRFTAVSGEQMATIGIKDTGPGIPPQDRGRVFERFYQVDAARSGQAGGSGLGLSIAKHIIEAQGGKIWAEAGVPNGACICFTISLADRQA